MGGGGSKLKCSDVRNLCENAYDYAIANDKPTCGDVMSGGKTYDCDRGGCGGCPPDQAPVPDTCVPSPVGPHLDLAYKAVCFVGSIFSIIKGEACLEDQFLFPAEFQLSCLLAFSNFPDILDKVPLADIQDVTVCPGTTLTLPYNGVTTSFTTFNVPTGYSIDCACEYDGDMCHLVRNYDHNVNFAGYGYCPFFTMSAEDMGLGTPEMEVKAKIENFKWSDKFDGDGDYVIPTKTSSKSNSLYVAAGPNLASIYNNNPRTSLGDISKSTIDLHLKASLKESPDECDSEAPSSVPSSSPTCGKGGSGGGCGSHSGGSGKSNKSHSGGSGKSNKSHSGEPKRRLGSNGSSAKAKLSRRNTPLRSSGVDTTRKGADHRILSPEAVNGDFCADPFFSDSPFASSETSALGSVKTSTDAQLCAFVEAGMKLMEEEYPGEKLTKDGFISELVSFLEDDKATAELTEVWDALADAFDKNSDSTITPKEVDDVCSK
eukprot:CAMPEP_0178537058 /NCGR_PEP_ID=MMETSP0696-20121128/36401_1 /TAXON_ID=265572 /ORGANISM="Extubocellulus spinifer, Strain CCMP396" /LENGTH=487 /DNA_ID=CAMNT_0020169289 /DNA_START=46 /DNA_END=1509 /DNA_ORIENTATION=+